MRPVFDATDGVDGRVSIEVSPDLAHDTDATIDVGPELWDARRPAQRADQDPRAPPRAAPAITDDHRPTGISVNVTLIFGLERYREVMEAYVAGLEQAARQRPRPADDPLGRVVLRLPRGHRDRQAARRDIGPGTRPTCAARPASPTPGWPSRCSRSSSRRPLGRPRGRGRPQAAPAVGLDRRQEPRLPRHDVRRRPGRRGHRQHDAREDPRRRRRPRRHRAATRSRPLRRRRPRT